MAIDEREQVGVEGVVVAGVQAVPGARVHAEAGSGDEFGGFAAGEADGGRSVLVSVAQDRGDDRSPLLDARDQKRVPDKTPGC